MGHWFVDASAWVHEWFDWIVVVGLFLALWALERLADRVRDLRYTIESMQQTINNIEEHISPPVMDDY